MPMYTVFGCSNSERSVKEKVSFHRFPKNNRLQIAWINACKRGDNFNIESARVCSSHFEDDDFERDLKSELLNLNSRKRLKSTAIPHLIPSSDIKNKRKADVNSKCKIRNIRKKEKSGDEDDGSEPEEKKKRLMAKKKKENLMKNCTITKPENKNNTVSSELLLSGNQETFTPQINIEENRPDESTKPFEVVIVKQEKLDGNCSLDNVVIKEEPVEEVDHLATVDEDIPGLEELETNIKAEELMITDVHGECSTVLNSWICEQCGHGFEEKWSMEQHILDNHPNSSHTDLTLKKKIASNFKRIPTSHIVSSQAGSSSLEKCNSSIVRTATTTKPNVKETNLKTMVASVPILRPIRQTTDKHKKMQYLVCVPQSSEGLSNSGKPFLLPFNKTSPAAVEMLTPTLDSSSLTDSSDTFSVSLAQFPLDTRVEIKKKLLEVIETVEKHKIDPKLIIIARKC